MFGLATKSNSVADPGFPVGGVDSQGSYISKILYVKTKESGPLGGVCRARPLNPPMQLDSNVQDKKRTSVKNKGNSRPMIEINNDTN